MFHEMFTTVVAPASRFVDRSAIAARGEVFPIFESGPSATKVDLLVLGEHAMEPNNHHPPPEAFGRIDSAPPGVHAGNMDNKELVAGSTLYLPVHARGALFEVGDGHAGQGNGEVDITAMETSLVGTLQFIVHKGTNQKYPRAETPTHYISMGFHQELYEATRMAVREMIDFLMAEKHLSHDDAYMLTSVAGSANSSDARPSALGSPGAISHLDDVATADMKRFRGGVSATVSPTFVTSSTERLPFGV